MLAFYRVGGLLGSALPPGGLIRNPRPPPGERQVHFQDPDYLFHEGMIRFLWFSPPPDPDFVARLHTPVLPVRRTCHALDTRRN